jgi:predicted naringenin-chalcone synthase
MYLLSLSNCVPPHRFRQKEVWESLVQSTWATELRPGAMELLNKVLNGNSGIDTRHFCLPDLDELFTLDAESLNQRFEVTAPVLGSQSLTKALDRAGLLPKDLDALFVCTCTGYLCPGLASHISHRVGLRTDAFLLDNVGQGCGAAIPTLRAAQNFTKAHPQARVACIAVEVCSAAFYLDNDPGVLISAALFADGASASIWSGVANKSAEGRTFFCDHFQTLHLPEKRELLRFVNSGGKLRNVLDRSVPALAAETVAQLHSEIRNPKSEIILIHPGGKKVLEAVEEKLPSSGYAYSREVLKENGNMSSPSVLFALERALEDDVSDMWLCSFGAGYTCYACRVTRS